MALHGSLFPNQRLIVERAVAEGGREERDGIVVQSLAWWAVVHWHCHLGCYTDGLCKLE